jgi:hypothetical protein
LGGHGQRESRIRSSVAWSIPPEFKAA